MRTARVGELELCYESMGEGDPILLIMGIGAQMVHWPDDFCAGLVERGYRVIRFDNRDVGGSTRLDHLGAPPLRDAMLRWVTRRRIDAPYALDDMADDAAGLIEALELPAAHVVGCSMGGMISQLVAIRHPDRVKSLTSIMSHPGDTWSSLPLPRGLKALLMKPPRTREEAEAGLVAFYKVVGSTGYPLDEASIRHRAGTAFDRGSSPTGFLRQMLAVMTAQDRRPDLARVRLPSLVVHGAVDPLVRPRGGYQTAKALPNAEYLRIDGMGHDLPRAVWPRIFDAFERAASRGPE